MGALALLAARRRSRRDDPLPGRLPARQPLLPLPRPPRHGQHAPRHRQELQHLFLRDGPPHRLRRDRADGASGSGSARNSTCRWSARATAPSPTASGRRKRYKDNRRLIERPDWTASDTLNASIGQGFLIVNPLQLAVMAARIASGRDVQPRLIGAHDKPAPLLGIPQEHLDTVRGGMWEVVNGDGTAGASRLHAPGHRDGRQDRHRAGAQDRRRPARPVGRLEISRPRPVRLLRARPTTRATPASVVIEHGLGGARAAAPVAKDVLTYLFDQPQALDSAGRARDRNGAGRWPSAPRGARRRSRPPSKANAGLRA